MSPPMTPPAIGPALLLVLLTAVTADGDDGEEPEDMGATDVYVVTESGIGNEKLDPGPSLKGFDGRRGFVEWEGSLSLWDGEADVSF